MNLIIDDILSNVGSFVHAPASLVDGFFLRALGLKTLNRVELLAIQEVLQLVRTLFL